LTALRRYRDTVLARQPGGAAKIEAYYQLAPSILARMPQASRASRLAVVYARYILPAALAVRLGMNALAGRLYLHMLVALTDTYVPERAAALARFRDQP
jgi:hypothetical protein